MLNENDVDVNNEKKDEDIDIDNEKKDADDTGNGSQDDVDTNNEKKDEDENPYAKQLRELEAENKKKDEMLKQKTAALYEAKAKAKEVKTEVKADDNDDDKPLTRKEMLELLKESKQIDSNEAMIKEKASNEDEANLMKAFVNKGYSVEDAYLKANAHIIEEHKRMAEESFAVERNENYLTKFSSGTSQGKKGSPQWSNNPILREAAKELDKEDLKFLGR